MPELGVAVGWLKVLVQGHAAGCATVAVERVQPVAAGGRVEELPYWKKRQETSQRTMRWQRHVGGPQPEGHGFGQQVWGGALHHC